MVNREGNILLANAICESMFGYDPGTLAGTALEQLIPQKYQGKHVQLRKQYTHHPEPKRMGMGRDLSARRKDGSEFPVEVSLSHTTIDGQLFVVAFLVDITWRKVSEEALKKSEEQLIVYAAELEKKVQSRTEALKHTIKQLEQSNSHLQRQIEVTRLAEEETRKALEKEHELNELKSKFVSIASHEFRTPLSVILSSTTLIQKYGTSQWEKTENHITRIKGSVNQLTLILNDFLSLGKLEEGKIEVIKEFIMLSEFFKSLQEDFHPLLKEKQQLVIRNLVEEKPIETDPRILRNILINLVSNAIKYSAPGTTIYIQIKEEKKVFRMDVIDEGIGIPESEIKHLFDRFFRASNVSNIQGTGLGLNIVKRYVELLGGSIEFSSIENKGSTFSVTLPIT